MTGFRIALGVISLGMTAFWLVDYLGREPADPFGGLADLLGRAGMVMITIFLAWPAIERNAHRIPSALFGMAAVLAIFLIVRPKLLPLVVLGCVVFAAVNWGLRFFGARRK